MLKNNLESIWYKIIKKISIIFAIIPLIFNKEENSD